MAKLESIKIYEDGTMIAITSDLDIPISSEPFGNVRVRPFGTQGLSFIRLSTNESIVEVLDFNNILDAAGSPYSGTYLGTFSALNAFLDKCCPSGGGGSGEANTASNLGAGDGLFKQKIGVDLQFKSLIAGSGISIANNANDLTLSASGSQNININNVAVNYTIDASTDQGIVAGANITLTLPASPTIGQPFYIFANGNDITISANVGQNIIGQSEVSIKDYSSITLYYVAANNWLIN